MVCYEYRVTVVDEIDEHRNIKRYLYRMYNQQEEYITKEAKANQISESRGQTTLHSIGPTS